MKRGQNMPRIYANSILVKNAQDAIAIVRSSDRFEEDQKNKAAFIITRLFSSKSRSRSKTEEAESRIDYIADYLGVDVKEVIHIVNILRELKILADTKDLNAFIRKGVHKKNSLEIVTSCNLIENILLQYLEESDKTYNIKALNEMAQEKGCEAVTPSRIKNIFNFWVIKKWIKRYALANSRNDIAIQFLQSKQALKERMEKRHDLAHFIVEYLYRQSKQGMESELPEKEEVSIEFSVHELKNEYEKQSVLFKTDVSIEDIEDTLFYLSRIEAIKIEGGFLVVYNRLTIDRLEQDNKKRYKVEDYRKLDQFYENKIQQIHIIGEYARKMLKITKAL